jgi:hypothetical protein
MNLRGGKSTPALLAACSAAAIVAASGSAMAAPPPNCPTETGTGPGKIPFQTIKIFNDTTARQIYAELEVGLNNVDEWIQDICNVPEKDKKTLYPYPTTLTNRFYINGLKGIPPGGSVTITLPLYTQLVPTVVPTSPNQYAEWWQGQNLQVFASVEGNGPPKAFENYFNGTAPSRPKDSQKAMVFNSSNPTKPSCTAGGTLDSCTLSFFTDTAGTLPKFAPSQLLEATLGANQGKRPPPTDGSNLNFLYPTQADFDVSYVDLANLAATMGPVDNDQSGYVGSPLKPGEFTPLLNTFQSLNGWPRYVDLDGTKRPISKLPSTLDLMALLSGDNAPADISPLPTAWPGNVWKPIQDLRTNWNTQSKDCEHSADGYTTFCDAILDVRDLIHANYNKYVKLMENKTCTGGAVSEDPDLTLAHVYGWSPWVESASGEPNTGCDPKANLLENTPGYGSEDKTYAKYAKVKTEFDNLNYGGPFGAPWKPAAPYDFNPWVTFIHGKPPGTRNNAKGHLGMASVYSYSVDDAVGNLNVYAKGYIVDIGDTKHLENQNPAGPPIAISLGYSIDDAVRFETYSVCGPNKDRPVNPADPQFIISAINPETCPVWLTDNEGKNYTFTLKPENTTPPLFTEIPTEAVKKAPSDARWSNGVGYPGSGNNPTRYDTVSVVDCSGNTTRLSRLWCCTRLAPLDGKGVGAGVFAYSTPQDPPTGHLLYENKIITDPARAAAGSGTVCNMGRP